MNYLVNYQLSHLSLLVFFAVPFSYFILKSKYGHIAGFSKKLDFLLRSVACILALIIIVKVTVFSREALLDYRLLGFLHLCPLVLTFLIVGLGQENSIAHEEAVPADQLLVGNQDYNPTPITSGIERVSWNDLVISEDLKEELISVINLLKDPATARKYGVDVPKGILFQGPPGTGKTTIAKVVANTANLSFFTLRMDEVISKWVGESEKNLSRLFAAAQKHSPAVIFIDEVDSIGKSRSSGSQAWADNLLNHLLQLIDGVVKTEGLYIIAATNRANLVDEALKRPGRLNKMIFIPLPDFDGRRQMFEKNLSKLPLAESVELDYLAGCTVGKSGAVIKQICNQAGLNAFQRESRNGGSKRSYTVTIDDINDALNEFAGIDYPDEDLRVV